MGNFERERDADALRRLGKALYNGRVRADLLQREVADRLGWSQSTITHLEHGDKHRPAFEDVVRLGAVYGLSPNALAGAAGYWENPEQSYPDQLQVLVNLLLDLPEPDQHEMLDWLTAFVQSRRTTRRPREGVPHPNPSSEERPRAHPARAYVPSVPPPRRGTGNSLRIRRRRERV